MSASSRVIAPVLSVGLTALLAGCGSGSLSGSIDQSPAGAQSPRDAVNTFFRALEARDGAAIRGVMTPMAQKNESISGGLLQDPPELTSFKILRVERENPATNASQAGSIRSLRYTVALTPADAFSNDNITGDAYGVLVSETPEKRWLVAELGGCC